MPITSSSVKKRTKMAGSHVVIADIVLGTYATGGEPIDPQTLGLASFEFVLASPSSGYHFEFDYTNKKIKAFLPTAGHSHTENTAAAYTQNTTTTASTAVTAVEVANGTNLSAVAVRLLVVGT